jgi:hypothetical protein
MASPVIPVLSKLDPKKWEGTPKGVQLEEDLIRMGCVGLYEKPWIFQKGHAVEELLPPGTPRGVYRANPLAWTREVWRGVYSFAEEKEWRPGVNRKLLEKHLSSSYDVSECYHSDHFTDHRLRRVVEFLNPIFHPNRRERITARLATTYIEAYLETTYPDWGLLLEEAIGPQLRTIQSGGCSKTFLTPYLMHLYEHCGCLDPEESRMWKQGMAPQDHPPRALSQLTGGSLVPPVNQQEASSSRSPRNNVRPPRSYREERLPFPLPKDLTLAEKVAKFSRDVTQDVQQMEMELLEARSFQRVLRKMFGVQDTGEILAAALATREELTKVKKDLRASQKEHLETKTKAQETMVALTKLLAGQTSAPTIVQTRSPTRSPTRKKRRFIPNTSLSSDEDVSLTCPLSGAESPSSKDWGVKVYKRQRGLPVNPPGKGFVNPSPPRMDSPVESQVAMRDISNLPVETSNDPVDASNLPVETSKIPVDTPNPPVDLPVEFLSSPVDSPKPIPVATPNHPVNLSIDLPEDTSTSPDKSSG